MQLSALIALLTATAAIAAPGLDANAAGSIQRRGVNDQKQPPQNSGASAQNDASTDKKDTNDVDPWADFQAWLKIAQARPDYDPEEARARAQAASALAKKKMYTGGIHRRGGDEMEKKETNDMDPWADFQAWLKIAQARPDYDPEEARARAQAASALAKKKMYTGGIHRRSGNKEEKKEANTDPWAEFQAWLKIAQASPDYDPEEARVRASRANSRAKVRGFANLPTEGWEALEETMKMTKKEPTREEV